MNNVKTAKIERYSKVDFINQRYSRKHDRSIDRLKDFVEQAYVREFVKGDILDCGAGTGRFTIPIKDRGYHIMSVDASEAMLSSIRSKNRLIPLIRSDIEFLPFQNSSFDSIVSMHVLFHLPQYKKILKEYMRILRPGGRLLFEMQAGEHFETCRYIAKWMRLWPPKTSDLLDYSNSIHRDDLAHLVRGLMGHIKVCRSYDMFSTYWFVKIKFLSRLAETLLRYNTIIRFSFWLERKIIPCIPAFFSSRFFIVVEKISNHHNGKS